MLSLLSFIELAIYNTQSSLFGEQATKITSNTCTYRKYIAVHHQSCWCCDFKVISESGLRCDGLWGAKGESLQSSVSVFTWNAFDCDGLCGLWGVLVHGKHGTRLP